MYRVCKNYLLGKNKKKNRQISPKKMQELIHNHRGTLKILTVQTPLTIQRKYRLDILKYKVQKIPHLREIRNLTGISLIRIFCRVYSTGRYYIDNYIPSLTFRIFTQGRLGIVLRSVQVPIKCQCDSPLYTVSSPILSSLPSELKHQLYRIKTFKLFQIFVPPLWRSRTKPSGPAQSRQSTYH